MDRKIRLVIFDLDGTLMDAYQAVAASVNYAMKKMKYPPVNAQIIKRTVGWGERHLIRSFVKEEDIEETLRIYSRHHQTALQKGTKFLPGAKRLLEYLRDRRYQMAVASNRPTKFSLIALKSLKIKDHFRCVICADKVDRPKPAPDMLKMILEKSGCKPSQALYVGDMLIDIQTGRRARVKTIAVTTGSSSRQEIFQERPFQVIDNVFETAGILERIEKIC